MVGLGELTMSVKGILDAYVDKNVNLVIDLGDRSIGGQPPIKVEGNLVEPDDSEHIDEYRLLISEWDASITFTVREAMVKLELGKGGVVEDITITVLPEEIF
jgi:hypothetical protein